MSTKITRIIPGLLVVLSVFACGERDPAAPPTLYQITAIEASADERPEGVPYWVGDPYNVRVYFHYAEEPSENGVAYWSNATPDIAEVTNPCGSGSCSSVRVTGIREGKARIVAAWEEPYGSWSDTARIDFVQP